MSDGGKKRGGAPGPRTFKANEPTARDRVLTESLSRKVKELTGFDISPEHCRAVKWSLSRWYEDPETKELLNNREALEKKSKAEAKKAKAQRLLAEAEAELADGESDDDEDEGLEAEDEDDGDVFDEDEEKVDATF